MRSRDRIGLLSLFGVLWLSAQASAQDLAPAAYTPAPLGLNIVTVIGSISGGDISFDPSLPVKNGHARVGAGAIAFNRAWSLLGRSAIAAVGLPYVRGHVEGELLGEFQETSRSGLADMFARVSVNLYGAPTMTRKQFASYRQRTVIGASIAVGMPVGQYFPDKIINIGANRWSIKPELGVSRKYGKWTVEGDFAGVFFTDNSNFRNGATREQSPIVAIQGHLIHAFKPGLWLAGDANYWRGGEVKVNGLENTRRQENSRIGATLALPIRTHQVRIAYSFGAYTTIGGDFQSLGVSYSYAWMGRP